MEDKGEVKCIKFSLGNKILAVQRTLKSVVRNLHPATRGLELKILYFQSKILWDKCSRSLLANKSCSENSSIILRGCSGSIVVLLVLLFKEQVSGGTNSGKGEVEHKSSFSSVYISHPKQFDKQISLLWYLCMYFVCAS